MLSEQKANEIKDRYALHLLNQPGVSGVGVEKDEGGGYLIVVHLNSHDPKIRQNLPQELEGHPVKFIKSGPFYKGG
jgi:hypothetical protein